MLVITALKKFPWRIFASHVIRARRRDVRRVPHHARIRRRVWWLKRYQLRHKKIS